MYQRKDNFTISKLPFKTVTNCNTTLPIRVDPMFKNLIDEKKGVYKSALGKTTMSNAQVTAILAQEHKAMQKRLRDLKEEIECRIDFF